MLIPFLLARGTIHENAITSCGKEIDNVSFVYSMLRPIKGEFSKDRMKGEINAKVRKREESSQTQSDYSLETHLVDEGDAGAAAVLVVDKVLDGWNNDGLLTNNSDEVISDEGSASMIQQVSHCKRKLDVESSHCEKRLRQAKSNVSTITGKFHIYASQC